MNVDNKDFMDKVKLVRIRWKKGTERINVSSKDTIGTLIDYMVKKYLEDRK